MNKIFVIGDVHGCDRALDELLDKVVPSITDTMVFLGDYIDRGPASRQVVDKILALNTRLSRLITLMGNHEQMFLRYLTGQERDLYLEIGGLQTLESYGIENPKDGFPQIPTTHLHFFKELLTYWEDENYIYVHAGLQPGVHLSRQSPDWLLWARDGDNVEDNSFGKTIIYGHTVHKGPLVTPNKIGIDTGAVYGGHLTCLVLPDLKFISVRGKRFWPINFNNS